MKCFRMVLLAAAFCAWGRAQNTPSFEVASIKPNHSGDRRVGFQMQPGGRFAATNITVKQLIFFAYGIKENQLSGGPSWIDSDHYDISAKPEDRATPDQVKLMLRTLLADRFNLVFREETKELPVYVLTVAKNGPKLAESKVPAEPANPEPGRGPGRGGRTMRIGGGVLEAQGVTVSDFTNQLAMILGRNVIDKTGLTGRYDFNLKYTPDESQAAMFRGPGDGPGGGRDGGPPPPDPNGPSIFSAVQEQLGLKLEAQKGPVEVYLIDSIEKPSEN